MLVTHRNHKGNTQVKLEPELDRLSKLYAGLVKDIKAADEGGLSILKMRLMKKYEQIRSRIRLRLQQLGNKKELIDAWLTDLENRAFSEGEK